MSEEIPKQNESSEGASSLEGVSNFDELKGALETMKSDLEGGADIDGLSEDIVNRQIYALEDMGRGKVDLKSVDPDEFAHHFTEAAGIRSKVRELVEAAQSESAE